MSKAYKILTAGQWASWQDKGEFSGAPIDIDDGYIHLSTAEQVAETAAKHFAGLSNLVLAEVDLDQLGDIVHWEPSRGGQLFPHIYGTIPLDAVTDARAIPED
jgi:beta-hydroxylase